MGDVEKKGDAMRCFASLDMFFRSMEKMKCCIFARDVLELDMMHTRALHLLTEDAKTAEQALGLSAGGGDSAHCEIGGQVYTLAIYETKRAPVDAGWARDIVSRSVREGGCVRASFEDQWYLLAYYYFIYNGRKTYYAQDATKHYLEEHAKRLGILNPEDDASLLRELKRFMKRKKYRVCAMRREKVPTRIKPLFFLPGGGRALLSLGGLRILHTNIELRAYGILVNAMRLLKKRILLKNIMRQTCRDARWTAAGKKKAFSASGAVFATVEESADEQTKRRGERLFLKGFETVHAADFLSECAAMRRVSERSVNPCLYTELREERRGWPPCLVYTDEQAQTLEEYCLEQPLSAEDLQGLTDFLVSVLDDLHAMNVVHRDIRPQNIFVREKAGEGTKRYCLFDFGCAVADGRDFYATGKKAHQFLRSRMGSSMRCGCDVWDDAASALLTVRRCGGKFTNHSAEAPLRLRIGRRQIRL